MKVGLGLRRVLALFAQHDDQEFHKGFAPMLQSAYKDLFALHAENTWSLSGDKLISFFRTTDQTSDIVGRRQAARFQALASFAGHGETPIAKGTGGKSKEGKAKSDRSKETKALATINGGKEQERNSNNLQQRDVGLTVRIEVNLPSAADQETYDRIFRSIRENLLNAK